MEEVKLKANWYTKAVLTVIALALCWTCAKPLFLVKEAAAAFGISPNVMYGGAAQGSNRGFGISPDVMYGKRTQEPDQPIIRIPNLKKLKVAVITDSISCSRLARYVLNKNQISECPLKNADVILTVVRSSLYDPLNNSYNSIDDLKKDIENQLNISGPKGHIYVFEITEDLKTRETFHSSFEWGDYIDNLY